MPPKGERRKQQIVNTAKDMFIEKGYQSTHIGQVCEKLNIARGTVYQYFSNKKEIVFSILDEVVETIEDIYDLDDFNEFFKTNPTSEAVLQFVARRISSCITVLINEPIVIKLLFKEIVGVDTSVNNRVNQSVANIEKVIQREIEELVRRGIFKKEINPAITASMIVGGVMIVVYEYGKRNMDVLKDDVINSIANNYLYGVMA